VPTPVAGDAPDWRRKPSLTNPRTHHSADWFGPADPAPPNPSPQGGGEHTESVAASESKLRQ
jgi:hypothetical protein